MNVKRFTGRTSREAMQKVKQALGSDAVVLSTRPSADGGVEIMAMGPEGMAALENMRVERHEPAAAPASSLRQKATGRQEPVVAEEPRSGRSALDSVADLASSVQDDVRQLAMSTLSFQDYVRERMLKRRQAAITARMEPEMAQTPGEQLSQRVTPRTPAPLPLAAPAPVHRPSHVDEDLDLGAPSLRVVKAREAEREQAARRAAAGPTPTRQATARAAADAFGHDDLSMDAVMPRGRVPAVHPGKLVDQEAREALMAAQAANASMLGELKAMRELMKDRFESFAFVDRLQRTPIQAQMAQRMLDGGFSPVLIRKIIEGMPADVVSGKVDDMAWLTQVLQRNVLTAPNEANLEDQGGVLALIGSTGVGKTTTTAKLAALFAARHGAHQLGLITLDAYRMGAHEQLRAYGRILGVPVHIAHDRAALEDLLELLAGKKLVLIDTAGMPQRDQRTRELLEMISHPSIRKLLVVNAAAQGDAIEDVLVGYQAAQCCGVALSKLDEAVKLGPALDALIRHKLKILGVANGQRVPEDWHRLSSASLVHRALRASLNPAYRLDPSEVSLVFSSPVGAESPSQRPVA